MEELRTIKSGAQQGSKMLKKIRGTGSAEGFDDILSEHKAWHKQLLG